MQIEVTNTFSKGGRIRDFVFVPDISVTRRPTSDNIFCDKNYLEKETLEVALKSIARPVCGYTQ